MKTIKKLAFGARGALALALMLQSQIIQAAPFGSAFTYQGRLNSSGAPALDGLYDFRFTLHDAVTVGSPVGSALTVSAVPVTNGLFTVPLDFSAAAFTNGEARWLQLQVNTNGLTPLVTLNPRQRIAPAPQAIYAGSAAIAATATSVAPGAVTSAALAPGSVRGAAIADGSITGADLGPSLLNTTFWKLGGNADITPGTSFLGTTDFQPLEFKVNNWRGLRLEPTGYEDTVNVIGGSAINLVGAGVAGATIGGGGAGEYFGFGYTNQVRADFGTVSGGGINTIQLNSDFATIGGGGANVIQTNGYFGTIPGGRENSAADYAFAAGRRAKANHTGTFVWADSQDTNFTSTASNQFLIRATGHVGINKTNPSTALDVNGTVTATSFSGNGAGVTNLNATNLIGTIVNARLSNNVSLLGQSIESAEITDGTIVNADLSAAAAIADTKLATLSTVGKVANSATTATDVNAPNTIVARDATGNFSAGTVTASGLNWASSSLTADQGGSVELGNSFVNGSIPFIDFHYGVGFDQDHNVRLINNANGQLTVEGGLRATGGVVVDQSGLNHGSITNASLTFGPSSGEGIASRRLGPGGGNQYGLDFYTGSQDRMTILNSGNVGIGTVTPGTALEVNGTVTARSFNGSGSGLANVNAATLGGLNGSAFWKLGGNAVGATPGANVMGTTDNQALELRVNGVRGFVLQPGTPSPNVVGGGLSSVAPGLNAVTIGGGQENNVSSSSSTIAGGFRNSIGSGGQDSTIGGGQLNAISNNTTAATVAGGTLNTIGAGSQYASIGGGRFNRISDGGGQSTIGGGLNNIIDVNSPSATIGGGTNNIIGTNSDFATIGGGGINRALGSHATISGGTQNTSSGAWATVGGGAFNSSTATSSTVGGGVHNTSSGDRATVGGGERNTSSGIDATVGGGDQNTSSGLWATVGGGSQNTSSGLRATVGGGGLNNSHGEYGTVPGGLLNVAGGKCSFAAGLRAQANHDGSFVWADSTVADFASTADDQFSIRARGGVRLSDDTPHLSFGAQPRQMLNLFNTQYGIGVQTDTLYFRCESVPTDPLAGFRWYKGGSHHSDLGIPGPGGTEMMSLTDIGLWVRGTFVSLSDRNAKENFQPVDPRAVLDKVSALPLSEWNYKQDTATRHIGPMAQDFYAAFAVGPDDRHITTVDESGVALAAIQGLNQKVEGEVAALRVENAELKQRLERLEQRMNRDNGGAR